jgi:hypothetical protein
MLHTLQTIIAKSESKTDKMILLVLREYENALHKHPKPFQSPYDGYGVILEELDETWDAIKKHCGEETMKNEMKAVAAMAIRFLIDCC